MAEVDAPEIFCRNERGGLTPATAYDFPVTMGIMGDGLWLALQGFGTVWLHKTEIDRLAALLEEHVARRQRERALGRGT